MWNLRDTNSYDRNTNYSIYKWQLRVDQYALYTQPRSILTPTIVSRGLKGIFNKVRDWENEHNEHIQFNRTESRNWSQNVLPTASKDYATCTDFCSTSQLVHQPAVLCNFFLRKLDRPFVAAQPRVLSQSFFTYAIHRKNVQNSPQWTFNSRCV